jgi:DNA polymerase III epsilon subunit-like protein
MIVVDVEASGVDSERHSILSVGALDLDHPERQFYEECRIWDGAKMEQEAFEVNGFTVSQATDPTKQSEAELIHKFKEFALSIDERTFAGQNVSFDRDFLRMAAVRAKHTDWPFAHRTIDTHTLCYMHMIKRGVTPPIDSIKKHSALNLDAVLNYCGIPDEPDPHNALTGAKSHAEVIARLLYDKKLLPEFEQFEIPWHSS